MVASAQVELPAMPRADDVLALGIVLKHSGLAVGVDRLDDLLVDAALAYGPATVRTPVIPGDELAIDHEDADLCAVARNHLAVAIREFADTPHHIGLHPVPALS